MGDLTKNLSRHEFECKCGCGYNTVDFDLVNAIQDACRHFEEVYQEPVRVIITSGNRCAEHNASIDGAADNSQHIYARATDHRFELRSSGEAIPPLIVYNYYDSEHAGEWGLGIYSNRVHLDTRSGGRARWDAR